MLLATAAQCSLLMSHAYVSILLFLIIFPINIQFSVCKTISDIIISHWSQGELSNYRLSQWVYVRCSSLLHFAPYDMPHSMNDVYIRLASSIVSKMLICFNVSTMIFNKQTKAKQTEANGSEHEHFCCANEAKNSLQWTT